MEQTVRQYVGLPAVVAEPKNKVVRLSSLGEPKKFFGCLRLYVGLTTGWLGSRVVSVLDSGTDGPGFKSQSRRCLVAVLGNLFTPIVPLFTKQQNWQKPS